MAPKALRGTASHHEDCRASNPEGTLRLRSLRGCSAQGDRECVPTELKLGNGHYPKVGSLEALAELVTPVYIKTLDANDAWGNEFEVRVSKDGYEFRSLGRDGKRDKHEPSGLTGDLDADIVFSDVRFTQAPFED